MGLLALLTTLIDRLEAMTADKKWHPTSWEMMTSMPPHASTRYTRDSSFSTAYSFEPCNGIQRPDSKSSDATPDVFPSFAGI
jgi:hypothetical protein